MTSVVAVDLDELEVLIYGIFRIILVASDNLEHLYAYI